MRLEKIKLCGFKSFVDNTVLDLRSNLVAVIGPNGCGKSNIIDAIRWVMGESSAKYLRGDSLTDVIFNGSANRKPLGQASVELVFDNKDGSLGGEYSKYNQISVKRLLTRDGQSTYFLNNTRCRRKDITDVFLGTGLGPRSYSVIEQGMISRVIEAKPEELRNFVEEAAGISLYKKRRHETELRIKHTIENLDRISDLKQEQEKLLEKLQRQSVAATKFKEFKKHQDELELDLLAVRWSKINKEEEQSGEQIRTLAVELEQKLSQKASLGTALEEKKVEFHEKNDELKEVEKKYYEFGTQIARVEQTLTLKKERQEQLQDDLQAVENEKQHALSKLETDNVQLKSLEENLEEISPKYDELVIKVENHTDLYHEYTEGYEEIVLQVEELQNSMAEHQRNAEVYKNKVAHVELQCRDWNNKLEKLKEEQESIDVSELDVEVKELSLQLESQTEELDNAKEKLSSINELYEDKQQEVQDNRKEQNILSTNLQELKGKKVSIETLLQAALDKNNKDGKIWLEENDLHDNPRLSESIFVEPGWELACQIVLGDMLNSIVVDEYNIDKFTSTPIKLGFIQKGEYVADSGSLLSKVNSSLDLSFMNEVLFAENLQQALQMNTEKSIITKDGIWLSKNWVKIYKSKNNADNVLSLEADLKQIHQDISGIEEQLEVLENKNEEKQLEIQDIKREIQELNQLIEERNSEVNAISKQHSAKNANLENMHKRLTQIEQEVTDYSQRLTQANQEIQEGRIILEDALEKMAESNDEYEELSFRKEEAKEKLSDVTQNLKQEEQYLHEVELERQSLITNIKNIKSNLENALEQKEVLLEKATRLNAQLTEVEPDSGLQVQLDKLLQEQSIIEKELTDKKDKVVEVENTIDEIEDKRNEYDKEAQVIRAELEEIKMSWQALDVRKQTIEEQVTEENVDLEKIVNSLDENINEEELKQDIEALQEKIKRLGAINLAAVDEYESEKERNEYINKQYEDLTKALETLQEAIAKIDKETKSKFKETFEQLNSNFKTLYPKLFKGGEAYLELTGDDLLETGVSVMARPPGKKNSSIHALSGGEKALTAIALVFGIFQLNPAPFCVLDEVDAPLDDANVGRYSQLVKEMSSTVQFIFISHNKLTMEIAENLAGVTMREPGVSRLVSVDLEAATQMVV